MRDAGHNPGDANKEETIMEITEKLLLDNYDGLSKGLVNMSEIEGIIIWWEYRKVADGYHTVVSDRDFACEITLENDRTGTIPLSDENNNHPSLAALKADYNDAVGTSVAARGQVKSKYDSSLACLRIAAGLTQRQLADMANVSENQIQRFESGERAIGNAAATTVAAIAAALCTDVETLIADAG